MIDGLKNDEIINKFGGRFKLTALIQRRWLQLLQGARPMVPHEGLNLLEIVIKEIVEGKLDASFDAPADDANEVVSHV